MLMRDHRLEAVVRERQLARAAEMQPPDRPRARSASSAYSEMSRPNASRPGQTFMQVLDQEALAAADVEHAVAGLQAEVLDHVLGDRDPAAVVAVAAVAVFARSVEILLAVLAGDADVLGALRGGPLLDVALGFRIPAQKIDFGQQQGSPTARAVPTSVASALVPAHRSTADRTPPRSLSGARDARVIGKRRLPGSTPLRRRGTY